MTVDIDIEETRQYIKEAAERFIRPRYKKLQQNEIETKENKYDFVTAADKESEIFLSEYFEKKYPGCSIIGEEAAAAGKIDVPKTVSSKDGIIWIMDPVDGTYNFVHGDDHFAVMVACIVNGELLHSWIYDVVKDRFAYAEKGAGAWLGDERINVSKPSNISDVKAFIGSTWFTEDERAVIEEANRHFAGSISFKCAAHEYMKIAKGEYHFAMYAFDKPWDHLPGTLLLREAGGEVFYEDGSLYQNNVSDQKVIAVSNEELFENVFRKLLCKS